MIGSNNSRIFICLNDTDMRKSFSSLCGVIRKAMHLEPFSGSLFVFKNRKADRIKIVFWDGDGFVMWYKLLARGVFRFPNLQNYSSAGLEIDASTLRMILDGVDLSSIRRQHRFRKEPSERQETPTSITVYEP